MNRILSLLTFLLLSLSGMSQDFPVRVLDVADQKDRIYYYGGRNGVSSPVINQVFEWLLEEGDDVGDLRFQLLYYQTVTLDQNGEDLFTMTVNLSDIHLEDLPTFNGFDFTEEFSPAQVSLNLEIYSGKQRLRSKRVEGEIRNNQLVIPMKWNFKTEAREIRVSASNPDFIFTNVARSRVDRKLEAIDSYIMTFFELDEIGVALNKFDPEKANTKTFERDLKKIEQYEKRFQNIIERSFWTRLDYQSAEKRTGFKIDEVRQQIGDYLNYLGRTYRGYQTNASELYADQALDFYRKGKFDKAQEELGKAVDDDGTSKVLVVQSMLDYQNGNINASSENLLKGLNSPSLTQASYDLAMEQGIVIRDHYIGETEKNLSKADKSAAINSFKKAKAWCSVFPEMDCPDELFERLRVQLVD